MATPADGYNAEIIEFVSDGATGGIPAEFIDNDLAPPDRCCLGLEPVGSPATLRRAIKWLDAQVALSLPYKHQREWVVAYSDQLPPQRPAAEAPPSPLDLSTMG